MYVVESRLRHQVYQTDFAGKNWGYSLPGLNVFSSHDFIDRWVFQSHNSMLSTPKRKNIHLLVSEIVLFSTTPYIQIVAELHVNSFQSFQMKAKATRSIFDCYTQSSLNGVSFVLCFFKFHCLSFVELLN